MAKAVEGGSRLATLAAQFETSGMSRREFCERHCMALSTLDYYRYRARRNKTAAVRLLPVSVKRTANVTFGNGLAVVFANGRRIEFPHSFTETGLTADARGRTGVDRMFGLGPATKIFVAVEAVDMSKGFEGLFGLVRDHLLQDPLSGHLYSNIVLLHSLLTVPQAGRLGATFVNVCPFWLAALSIFTSA